MVFKYFQRNTVLFLLLISIIIQLTDWSGSVLKVLFFAVILFIFILRRNKTIQFNSHQILGFDFFAFFIICNLLGFVYGYSLKYVLIDFAIIIPVLSAYFIDEKSFNNSDVLKYLKLFAIITAIFSIIMFFFWQKIGFLNHLVNNANADNDTTEMFSKFYRTSGQKDREIRATGIFPDAYQNGLFILGGLILVIEDIIRRRHSLLWNLLMLCVFGLAIYTTQTRNIYLLCGLVLCSYILLHIHKKGKNVYFFTMCFVYALIMLVGIVYAGNSLSDGGSLFARLYSWNIIFHDYLLNQIFSWHAWMGYGLIQFKSDFSPPVTYWMIDNSILTIFLGSGLIGVLLFLRWMYRLFGFLEPIYQKEKNKKFRSQLRITILLLTIYFLGGAMNVNVYSILFIFPILLLVKRTSYLISKFTTN